MRNVVIPKFPEKTFGSSAALIKMERVSVHTLHTGAFVANTYNIVMAINCSFHLIEGETFAPKSLINNLHLYGCQVHVFASKALQSAVANLNISKSRSVMFWVIFTLSSIFCFLVLVVDCIMDV